MDVEKKLDELFLSLGKEYFNGYLTGQSNREEISDLCKTIKPLFIDYKEQQREELEAKGLTLCEFCGSTIPIKSRFCNMCGRSLTEGGVIEDTAETAPIIEEKKEKKCVMCGEVLDDDAVFCPNCGHKNS